MLVTICGLGGVWMWDINYDTFRTRLKGVGYTSIDVEKILNIFKDIRDAKYRKVSQTLREKSANGLVCGRPKFKKPVFFHMICIYNELGFIETKAICKMFNIAPTTFYKYKRAENITTSELKDNRYKQPNNKQMNLYLKGAENHVMKWIAKNKPPIGETADLKNDCMLSIFMKLPAFKGDFGKFCYDACADTYYAFRDRYKEKRYDGYVADKITYKGWCDEN